MDAAGAINDDLAASLVQVAAIMAAARDPWWVIGSAAVAMLGAKTRVADIDVLLSTTDADAIDHRLGLGLRRDAGDGRFASTRYGRWVAPAVPVELMADLVVDGRPLQPLTRTATRIAGVTLYHPERFELIAILDRFGRPKDKVRIALLR